VPDDVLRVLTWNIRDLLGDPLAVHRVIKAANADVACLQEAPRLLFTRNKLAALARHSGMLFACGGRPSAGTAILTNLRVDVHEPRAVPLPVATWRTRPRGYAAARVNRPGGKPVLVASIHLGLTPQERADHTERILTDVRAAGVPVILAGDLNEPPDGPSWRTLADLARDPGEGSAPTFSAQRPRRRIDAVLVSPQLEVVDYGWPHGVSEDDVVLASDHRPVVAQVRVGTS
jgi:endonuclease/exonuclease/phosphatase family metal-dependent hydrolase